ncbi:hypothetical protein VTJ83DRAFT_31 [Remersonia thermophila]|uniref:Uncharacterized protein n=1 Tax=Remersonia thermophila TaxID=72144 RepID=A0ABR4DKH9_9PEZI
MITIESLLGSNIFHQLRAIVNMSSPADKAGPTVRRLPAPCGAGPHSTPPKRGRCRTRITRPEPGSLYDILHEHAGTTLYIAPICWTDMHSALLGARFRKAPAVVRPVPDLVASVWVEPSKMAQTLTAELHTLLRPDATPAKTLCKTRAMKHILSTLFPSTLSRPKTGAELNLYFGNRVFRKVVRVPCLWKSTGTADTSFDSCPTLSAASSACGTPKGVNARDPGMPLLAYISRSQLANIRQNLYGVLRGPGGMPNEPVARLQKLRAKMLVPADPAQDPYMVAIMLAMAQAHCYHESPGSSRASSQVSSSSPPSSNSRRTIRVAPPAFRDVRVQIITHDEGSDQSSDPCFYVYSATITATFMERFLSPHKAPRPRPGEDSTAGIDITCTPVNIWPVLGLRERLARALGDEMAADAIYDDPDYIGLWDPLLEPRPQMFSPVQRSSFTRPSASASSAYKHSVSASSLSPKRKRKDDAEAPMPRGGNMATITSSSSSSSSLGGSDPPSSNASSSSDDRPLLSPATKRRRTARPASTLEVC